jgi:hypothetical protein
VIVENVKPLGHRPLIEYPWAGEIDRLLNSAIGSNPQYRAFLFDAVVSLAYIDATAGLERSIERCDNVKGGYNAHLGFINLCSPCYTNGIWQYQKAAKPESGALGKLSSEIILKFVEHFSANFVSVSVIGGSDYADAVIQHISGLKILAEVKSAPLMTYPLLINAKEANTVAHHQKLVMTSSQLRVCETALYLHDGKGIPLGKAGSENWPFKGFVDFVLDDANQSDMAKHLHTWMMARDTYKDKNRQNKYYYLTNACGSPPAEAKKNHGWPQKEVISDGKTSAGMDRTDDIKKGIYQTLKIGVKHKQHVEYRTAIISNLPAYRHGVDYVEPLVPMLWGFEEDLEELAGKQAIPRNKLRYAFDYIITLEEPLLRGLDI